MLEDSLTYPTKGEGGIVRILVGGGLCFLFFLIVPILAASGYLVRALAGASCDEAEPPVFEDWGGLIADGLKALLISVAYSIVPLVLLGVFVVLLGAGGRASDGAGGVLAGIGVVMMLLYLGVALAINYVLPAAITNFGREGSMGAAFDFETLKPVLTSGSYVKAVLLTFLVSLVVGVVFTVFALLTFGLGYLVAPFVYFYVYLAGAYMFGTAFGDTAGIDGPGTGRTGAAPTAD